MLTLKGTFTWMSQKVWTASSCRVTLQKCLLRVVNSFDVFLQKGGYGGTLKGRPYIFNP